MIARILLWWRGRLLAPVKMEKRMLMALFVIMLIPNWSILVPGIKMAKIRNPWGKV